MFERESIIEYYCVALDRVHIMALYEAKMCCCYCASEVPLTQAFTPSFCSARCMRQHYD